MPKTDPRVDAYIAKSADFAKPILVHVRRLVHAACPEVEETLKWGMPHFGYHGVLLGMAAFKQHCTVHFWQAKLVLGDVPAREGMGNFGKITALADLPKEKVLLAYIKKAVKVNASGTAAPRRKSGPAKLLPIPDVLAAGLKKNKKARTAFEAFAPSHKNEYIEWITEAKREETRAKRLATALEWLSEGKSRHWKYEKC